mgnify:CR=1 FL=1
MPIARVNEIEIEYDIEGDGPSLVLIAGLGYERWMWHRLVPGLAQSFQVITYDNRGVGGSSVTDGPYSAQLLADDLAGLLDLLDIGKTAVLGHSMGGYIAQAFALAYPEKVSKLILSATNFGGPNHIPVTQEALAVLMDTTSDPVTRLRNGILASCAQGFAEREPEFVQSWLDYRAAHPVDPQGYQAQMGIGLGLMAEAACFEHKLANIEVPTLVISGSEDKVVPPGNVALLAAKLSDVQTAVIEDAGHFYVFEQPETAVTIITQFLQ